MSLCLTSVSNCVFEFCFSSQQTSFLCSWNVTCVYICPPSSVCLCLPKSSQTPESRSPVCVRKSTADEQGGQGLCIFALTRPFNSNPTKPFHTDSQTFSAKSCLNVNCISYCVSFSKKLASKATHSVVLDHDVANSNDETGLPPSLGEPHNKFLWQTWDFVPTGLTPPPSLEVGTPTTKKKFLMFILHFRLF